MSESDTKLNSLRKTMRKISGQLPKTDAGYQRKIDQYEMDIENLQAQVKALEEEMFHLRRRLEQTPKEFELLSFLSKHAGRVLTHRQILTAVWGPAHTEDTQYLRVYVGQLRQKVEEHADDPRIILTEPGIGYRIADS